MKPIEQVAEELCRWFTPDNEPIELTDVAHTREVIARCYADALRHAAELCMNEYKHWESMNEKSPESYYEGAMDAVDIMQQKIQAEADKLTEGK